MSAPYLPCLPPALLLRERQVYLPYISRISPYISLYLPCISRQHVFCASAKSPTDLYCIFCAEGGGGGLTQAERKKLALTHKKADQAINAASRAVNMPAPVA